MIKFRWLVAAAALPFHLPCPAAVAQSSTTATQAEITEELLLRPIVDVRTRFEAVEQGKTDADALTIRLRAGAEATMGRWSLLAEVEGTAAPLDSYNAFPFAAVGEAQWRPRHSVIADPQNVELNRLQIRYKQKPGSITLGRQRINLDDQRWVGSVGWRQNEQTYDAVRAEAQLGPVAVDLTYAMSQRTIFGKNARPRTAYDGDFLFAGIAAPVGTIQGKLFAYLLDYDEPFLLANSSQTYGGILSGSLPVGGATRLAFRASYARQSDLASNPFDYAAHYWSLDGGTTLAGIAIVAGWERLGSGNGQAVQAPMATLHKFNGWADMFLTTPPAGLDDLFVSAARKFAGVRLLPGLNVNASYHRFESAEGNRKYGSEWDASVGFKIRTINVLLKYADYAARHFGTDTRKLWLQAEWSY